MFVLFSVLALFVCDHGIHLCSVEVVEGMDIVEKMEAQGSQEGKTAKKVVRVIFLFIENAEECRLRLLQ